jgi:hypothetical protein
VTVMIPGIDRTKSDLPRLPWIISRVCGTKNEFFELACEFGVLNDCYRASDLDLYHGLVKVNLDNIENMKKVSLHVAAAGT